jgi:hypothetical protein
MIKKLTLLVGVGAGYVLGAKAGTQRYDQIMGKVNELMGKPAVKDATSSLSSSATQLADKAKSTLNDKVDSVRGSTASAAPDSPSPIVDLPTGAPSLTEPPVTTAPDDPTLQPRHGSTP